jgi:hypothetical protein
VEGCQIILQKRCYEFEGFGIHLTGFAAWLEGTSLRSDMDRCKESFIAIAIDGSVTPAK